MQNATSALVFFNFEIAAGQNDLGILAAACSGFLLGLESLALLDKADVEASAAWMGFCAPAQNGKPPQPAEQTPCAVIKPLETP